MERPDIPSLLRTLQELDRLNDLDDVTYHAGLEGGQRARSTALARSALRDHAAQFSPFDRVAATALRAGRGNWTPGFDLVAPPSVRRQRQLLCSAIAGNGILPDSQLLMLTTRLAECVAQCFGGNRRCCNCKDRYTGSKTGGRPIPCQPSPMAWNSPERNN
jgi:hypothetical protein